MLIVVNDVGDANCNWISNFDETMMIDFGGNWGKESGGNHSSQKNSLEKQLRFSDAFLLSHYHEDHYNMLLDLHSSMKTQLKNFYFPFIPNVAGSSDEKILVKDMYLMHILCRKKETGSPALTIYKKLKELNGSHSMNLHAVHKGDCVKLGQEKYDVIWPPERISAKGNKNGNNSIPVMSKKCVDAMNEVDSLLEQDAELHKIWKAVDRMTEAVCLEQIDEPKEDFDDAEKYSTDGNILGCVENVASNIKNKVIKKLKEIANSLSVCLYRQGEFLFLGDLENADIKPCISDLLKKTSEIYVQNFIAPHHGTHWHNCLGKSVHAHNILVSVGNRLQKKVHRPNYKGICKNLQITWEKGMLVEPRKVLQILNVCCCRFYDADFIPLYGW